MKKKITLAIVILAFLFLTRPGQRVVFATQWWFHSTFTGETGLYNPQLREYYCINERACKHEEGHKEDHLLGWFSETDAFDNAIEILETCDTPGLPQLPFIQLILSGERDTDYELYANLYENVELGEYNNLVELMNDYADRCRR